MNMLNVRVIDLCSVIVKGYITPSGVGYDVMYIILTPLPL